MFTKRIPVKERFESQIAKSSDSECWLWTGAPNSSGYGTIRMGGRNGKTVLAHRLSYELYIGTPPQSLCVCHTCDNRLCVNPSHLFLGTVADNNADRDKKGRCNAGSKPGEDCGHSKLKIENVLAIRGDNRTHDVIAKQFNVARSTITNIKARRTWRHI